MNNTIGIDFSKDTLDFHLLTDGRHKQFLNGKTGHTQLINWIELQPDPQIILKRRGRIISYWSEGLAKVGAALQLVTKNLSSQKVCIISEIYCAHGARS
jgi:transposase